MTSVHSEMVEDGLHLLTLDRPNRLNAMNAALIADLHRELDRLASNEAVRVLIVTGAGRGFCSGLDLTEGATPAEHASRSVFRRSWATQESIAALIPQLRDLPFPTIAAVNGAASGGGLALALGCDIRVAAASARFNVAFIRVGLSACDIGVSWLLPRVIGAGRAWELMLTGRLIDAEEAERIGLVVRVVPDGTVVASALETARLVAANSPFGVRMTKQVMWSQLEISSLHAGIDMENRTQVMTTQSGDLPEAMRAFAEKRAPRFTGE